jgi:hypothetical protein
LCDFLEREYNIQNIVRIQPKEYGGDKFTRFSTTLPRFALNQVWLPHNTVHAKSKTCADQLITFPKGINDDFVDALSQAINYVEKNDVRKGGGSKEYGVDTNDEYRDNPFSANSLSDIMTDKSIFTESLNDVRSLF